MVIYSDHINNSSTSKPDETMDIEQVAKMSTIVKKKWASFGQNASSHQLFEMAGQRLKINVNGKSSFLFASDENNRKSSIQWLCIQRTFSSNIEDLTLTSWPRSIEIPTCSKDNGNDHYNVVKDLQSVTRLESVVEFADTTTSPLSGWFDCWNWSNILYNKCIPSTGLTV